MKKVRKILVTVFILFAVSILLGGCKKTKYKVTFNPNGGVLTSEATVTAKKDSLLEKPTDPTREDYEFLGWYISDDQGETLILEWKFESRKVQSNITIYAKWNYIGEGPEEKNLIEDLLNNGQNNEQVEVEGTVYYLGSDGFYVADSELGKIYVEYNTAGKNIAVSKEVSVKGVLNVSGNVRKITATEVSLIGDAEPLVPLTKTLKEIVSLSNLAKTGSWYGYFKVIGRVEYDQALMEINIYSDDNQDFFIIDSRSDVEYLKDFQGERVELEVVLSAYDNISSFWSACYVKDKVVEAHFSSAEIKAFANQNFSSTVNDEILGGGLVLPARLPNIASLTITWTTNLEDYIAIEPLEEGQSEYQTIITVPEQDENGKLFAHIQYKNLDPIVVEVDVIVKRLEKTSLETAINEAAYMSLFDGVVVGFAAGQNITFRSYIIQDLANPNVVITVDYYGSVNDGFDTYIDDVEVGDILTFVAQYRKEGRPCFVAVKTTKTNDKQDPVYNLEGAPVLNEDNFGDFPGYNTFVKLENPFLQYSTSGIPAKNNWVRLGYPNAMIGSFGVESNKTLAFLIRPLDELMGEDFRSSLEVPFSVGEPIEYDGDIYGFVLYESDSYFQFVAVNTEHFVPSHRLRVINDLEYAVSERLEEGNLVLPITHEFVEGVITWTSDNENIINSSGDVTYPELDTIVTLTAKFMVDDLDDEHTLVIRVLVIGQVRVVYELDEALAEDNLEIFNVRGYVLQVGYSDSVSDPSTSELDVIFLQDRTSGKIIMVRGLESKYNDDAIKVGYEIEFSTEINEADGVRTLIFKGDLRVTDEAATLVDYKDNAIVISSHEDALVEFAKDFHFGQVFKIEGPVFFNSTTSDGNLTNLRFHLNENASGLSDIQYGGRSLVFNVNGNKAVIGEDFVEDLFGFDANPGIARPGTLRYVDLYFVVKKASSSYFYCVLLDQDDVVYMGDHVLVEVDIRELVAKEVLTGDLDLPTTHELIDGVITWTSDNVEVIANDGRVTYPETNTVVVMTAEFKTKDSEDTHSFSIEVTVIGVQRVVIEVDEALELDDDELFNVGGIVVQVGYSESTSDPSTSTLNAIYLQDRLTGTVVVVTGLNDLYLDETIKVGYEIEFLARLSIAESNVVLTFQDDLRVIDENASIVDYKADAIRISSHEEALSEFAKNLRYGQVYYVEGPVYFNSTTSTGAVTNLRFHLNPNCVDLADLQYGGKSLVFNVNSNKPALGNDFVSDIFGFMTNPGSSRPGILKYVNLYFVVKNHSASYYYLVLLSADDVSIMDTNLIVEHQIVGLLPKEMLTGNMALPTDHELLDGAITWTSDKPEVIANDGSVTYPDEEVTVTLTASFKIEAIEYEFSIEVLVKPPVPLSVSEVILEAEDEDIVLVEGIVVGFHWNGSSTVNEATNGIIIKDETGNEILYVIGLYGNYGSTRAVYVVDEHTLKKGDKIRFVAIYNLATTEGHAGRKTLTIQSAEIANLKVLASEVTYEFDLDSAVEVSKQDDLAEIAENLPYGTLFKLIGDFGFRGSASSYGTGVNLQTSYVRTTATDYNMTTTWADRGQRFSFKFDGNVPNLGGNWWVDLLGITSNTYTGTAASGMSFEEGAYIYFYLGHSLPKAASANGYIQLVILDSSWVNATLKTGE